MGHHMVLTQQKHMVVSPWSLMASVLMQSQGGVSLRQLAKEVEWVKRQASNLGAYCDWPGDYVHPHFFVFCRLHYSCYIALYNAFVQFPLSSFLMASLCCVSSPFFLLSQMFHFFSSSHLAPVKSCLSFFNFIDKKLYCWCLHHRIRSIYRTINRPFGIARSFSLRHIGGTRYPVSKFNWRL